MFLGLGENPEDVVRSLDRFFASVLRAQFTLDRALEFPV
jgi:hypothetical protein